MTQQITSTSFTANWNDKNISLNPSASISWSIFNKIKNIFFYLPISLIAFSFNPRKASKFSSENTLRTKGRSFTKEIITPDGVKLRAKIFRANEFNSQTPYSSPI